MNMTKNIKKKLLQLFPIALISLFSTPHLVAAEQITTPPTNPKTQYRLQVKDLNGDSKADHVILHKRSVRTKKYKLYKWSAKDGLKPIPPFPVRTYRGYVEEEPALRVNATISHGKILSMNVSEGTTQIVQIDNFKVSTTDYNNLNNLPAPAWTGNKILPKPTHTKPIIRGGALIPTPTMRKVNLAVRIKADAVTTMGGIEQAVARMEQRINDLDYFYARDLGLAWELSVLVISMPDTTAKDKERNSFKDFWKQISKPEEGIYFNATTTQTNDSGGVSSGPLFKTKKPYGYTNCFVGNPTSVGSGAIGHELGHKLHAAHQLSAIDIMEGAEANIGMENVQQMIPTLAAGSYTSAPAITYSDPLPPYTAKDFRTTKANTSIQIKPLKNDYDGNGDSFKIHYAKPLTSKGGKVVISSDRRKLTYTPKTNFIGLDRINYQVIDQTGCINRTGHIKVAVTKGALNLYMNFDTKVEASKYHGGKQRELVDALKLPTSGGVVDSAFIIGKKKASKLYFVKGVKGKAYCNILSNSSAYIDVPDVGDAGTGSLTTSLWVCYPIKPKAPGIIVCKGAASTTNHLFKNTSQGWGIAHKANGAGFLFAGKTTTGPRFHLETQEAIKINKWYHLVITLDRKQKRMRAWCNGKELTNGESHIDQGVIESYSPLRLFNAFGRKARESCIAVIDELTILNKAISTTEVKKLYNQFKTKQFEPIDSSHFKQKKSKAERKKEKKAGKGKSKGKGKHKGKGKGRKGKHKGKGRKNKRN